MLDKVKVVDLAEWRGGEGPVAPIAPPETPEIEIGSSPPRFYQEEPSGFSWKPALIVALLFLGGVLIAAFL